MQLRFINKTGNRHFDKPLCFPACLVTSGARLSAYHQINHLSHFVAFVSQSGWWCPPTPVSPIPFPLWHFISFPVWLVVSGSPTVSHSFVSPCSNSLVSESGWWGPGSPDVSNSFVSPSSNSFVSQFGWHCFALHMSPVRLLPAL